MRKRWVCSSARIRKQAIQLGRRLPDIPHFLSAAMICCAAATALLASALPAGAQTDSMAENLIISGTTAYTWTEEKTTVVQVEGPVTIDLDSIQMKSRQAVIWITPLPRSVASLQRFEISLLNDAVVTEPGIVHEAKRLFVEGRVRGNIRITANRRGVDQSASETYKEAGTLRPMLLKGGQPSGRWVVYEDKPTAPTTTQPVQEYRPQQTVRIRADFFETDKTPEGRVVGIFRNLLLLARTAEGDYIELAADRAVVFTPYLSLTDIRPGEQIKQIEQAVTGVYLEGDVRITQTPRNQTDPEQKVTANRAFYDLTTDRAVMTDVVLHSSDPKSNIPMVVRARMVRQLSQHEYTAENGRLSTSSFRTPSYSIGARSTYIRQTDVDDPITGTRTNFVARDATIDLLNTPVFYSPVLAGSLTERGAFRNIETSNSRQFGFGVSTTWGLFETLHRLPPKGTDASYKIDYFTDRGPAFGLDGKYIGGLADVATLEPWSYSGDFRSYVVFDHGVDDLGRRRVEVDPEQDVRGRLYWRHQHFFPGDWQVQLTAGYISDPTFLEQWFNREFRTQPPLQTSLYAKHQQDSEAYTLLLAGQPNDFATVSEAYQEQAEVQRLPELSYRRIGDSLFDDHATFYSANTLSALSFRRSNESLAELGFRGAGKDNVGYTSPGFPSYGFTGTPEDTTYRGDFRQELDWPFTFYRFRAVPYVVGRFTPYSESVDGGTAERLMVGTGMRITTAFWKVDDSYESRLFDLHRLRHVIEPELNLYTSAQTTDRDELLIYDEPIDAVTDISAVQLALNQRWQTKRGGPGQWRSVDFFTWRLQANFFFNEPSDSAMRPRDFRGLYYVTMPEASIPRDSVNSQFEWKISDSVQILSDVYYNTEENVLSAASIGASVKHDPRLSYYLGLRHIGVDLVEQVRQNGEENTFIFQNQDLLIAASNYQLTSKYRVQFAYSYDLATSRNDRATLSLIRKFDRFFVSVSFRVDEIQNEQAMFFNLWPEGMEPGSAFSSGGPRGGSTTSGSGF